MKYYNKENAIIQIGARESVQPFSVTRDFTDEDVEKIPELRYAVKDRKWLVIAPKDSELMPAQVSVHKPNVAYTAEDEMAGGEVQKKIVNGRPVEYVMATEHGVDNVENYDIPTDGMVVATNSPRENKPLEHIESGVSARQPSGAMKTKWKNASDAFEEELTKETMAEEDDLADVVDGEEDQPDAEDADKAISDDTALVIQSRGKAGAVAMTVESVVTQSSAAAMAELEKAVAPSYDDAEPASEGDGKTAELSEFLAQDFNTKKWVIAKSSDKEFLGEVSTKSRSTNIRDLANQRLREIGD